MAIGRPIKIEIVKDEDIAVQAEPKPPTLLERLGSTFVPSSQQQNPVVKKEMQPPKPYRHSLSALSALSLTCYSFDSAPRKKQHTATVAAPRPVVPKRMKKGPKRLKKTAVTVADLDKEMEDYRASVNAP